MSKLIELPQYMHHKPVSALQIRHVIPNPRGFELHMVDERFAPFQMPAEWVALHNPQPGGYFVWNDDGHKFHLNADIFEACYSRIQ